MKFQRALAASLLVIPFVAGVMLPVDSPETPTGPRWWPSEWGAGDQRGAANRLSIGEVAADKVYEFAFVLTPLKLKGASGSPGNPLAIR